MEDTVKGCKSKITSFFRHRSPTFSKKEIQALLTLVNMHKSVILNKSINSAANHAKDATWLKIAKKFNSQGFNHTRNADSLKMKWENLKRELKKVTNNLADVKSEELDEVYTQMIAIMCDETSGDVKPPEPDEDDEVEECKTTSNTLWENNNKDSDESLDDDNNENSNENDRLLNQSIGFSTQECNLLLQCVRQEKDIVFSNINTNSSGEYRLSHHRLKNRAWKRIANSYNKLSPQKRSTQALRKKFQSMKSMASKVNISKCVNNLNKRYKDEHSDQKIKDEPVFEVMEDNVSDESNDEIDRTEMYEANSSNSITLDPLELRKNSLSENKGVSLEELLNYKMETAKLERKRIEDLIQADRIDREARSLETSYRLRAARLEAITAEMKLPSNHPALAYTTEETRLQYTQQYNT